MAVIKLPDKQTAAPQLPFGPGFTWKTVPCPTTPLAPIGRRDNLKGLNVSSFTINMRLLVVTAWVRDWQESLCRQVCPAPSGLHRA
jgi:hypothetical protein